MAEDRLERIVMGDGVALSVSLYLPHGRGPQPCLLEVLPYRKDDLTSSYAAEYERLRDEYGYAVARLDVRGTGSSEGRAVDEYTEREQQDLLEVIDWLSRQPWCDGSIGMYGTSYSGFNSLQLAALRPPPLKAVVAIYASDDRYEDDVHYMGGALRWLDLVDYCHYMTPMNALPPVPAVWGTGWREEWAARIAENEPWLLEWMAHQRRDSYWQHGSIRPAYDIGCAVMLVAGWADGYRNNSFRTVEALRAAGTPVSLLAGPWAHAAPETSLPGPHLDLVAEMVVWWDRWLRGRDLPEPPTVRWYARESHEPEADLGSVPGVWRADEWPSPRSGRRVVPLEARAPYAVRPDVGTAAWNSCAGHLPWGQPTDQRYDDADSLRWDLPVPEVLEIAGQAVLRARVTVSEPVATLSVKLCDVAPDGTSTLVARGLLNLARRGGTGSAEPMVVGEPTEVRIPVEATAWRWLPGRVLRVSIAGADWPNTVAPPRPVTIEVLGGELELPTYDAASSPYPAPVFADPDAAGAVESGEPGEDVLWRISRDVLRRRTRGEVDHGDSYDTPYGSAVERYKGAVEVDRRTFAQRAEAQVSYVVRYADDGSGAAVECTVTSTLEAAADERDFTFDITLQAREGDRLVGERTWHRTFPRDLA